MLNHSFVREQIKEKEKEHKKEHLDTSRSERFNTSYVTERKFEPSENKSRRNSKSKSREPESKKASPATSSNLFFVLIYVRLKKQRDPLEIILLALT